MIQELFHIGPIPISPFGVLLALAFLAAFFQLRRGLAQVGVGDADTAGALVFAGGIGGVVGAKVYYAILHHDWHLLFERAGLVWYGGFVLGSLAVLWTMRRQRLPLWPVLDAMAPALALGYGIGRIGCFLVGDDYGVPTTLPWGVAFANGLPPTTAFYLRHEFGVAVPASIADSTLLRVHPTQLYEMLAGIAIFWIGARLLRRGLPAGRTALAVFALLAVERFLVEILRAKDDRLLGSMTLAQAISLVILLAVAVLWRSRGAAAPREPAAAPGKR
jgi:phosphatidylglycerol:prolipoprotein diacylglycerol transferase